MPDTRPQLPWSLHQTLPGAQIVYASHFSTKAFGLSPKGFTKSLTKSLTYIPYLHPLVG